jgi:hypothetical protein
VIFFKTKIQNWVKVSGWAEFYLAKQAKAHLALPAHLGLVNTTRADRFGRSVGQTRPIRSISSPPRASAAHGAALASACTGSGEPRPLRSPPYVLEEWELADLPRHATSSAQRPPCSLRRPPLWLGFRPAAAALRRST